MRRKQWADKETLLEWHQELGNWNRVSIVKQIPLTSLWRLVFRYNLETPKPKLSLEERFHRKYRVGDNGCWEWTSSKNPNGYGLVYAWGKTRIAHRTAYELFVGPIPLGLCVLHDCDNPSCVNYEHLKLGTFRENNIEAITKGRRKPLFGEKHQNSKLTEQQVLDIRREYQDGATQKRLSQKYGVSMTNVHHIVYRNTWKHID